MTTPTRDVFAEPQPGDEIESLLPPMQGSAGRNVVTRLRVEQSDSTFVRGRKTVAGLLDESFRYPRRYWLSLSDSWEPVLIGGSVLPFRAKHSP